MKMLKIFSAIVALSMLLSSFTIEAALTTENEAMEGYGNYPESTVIDVHNSQTFRPTEFSKFKFAVKTNDTGTVKNYFTLLDRDAEGNYHGDEGCKAIFGHLGGALKEVADKGGVENTGGS